MTSSRSLIATGYVALDVISHGPAVRQRAGGTAANVASNLSHLGWRSALVGRIGDDPPGRRIVDDLRRAGVDCNALTLDPDLKTPVLVHEVSPPRHRFIFSCPECGRRSPRYSALHPEQAKGLDIDDSKPPDVVFVDRISPAAVDLLDRFAGSFKVLEPSSRGTIAAATQAAGRADLLKWSDEQRPALHQAIFEPRPKQVQVETLGSGGARFRIGTRPWVVVPALDIEPIDTAGAGDWLTAALLDTLPRLRVGELDDAAVVKALEDAQGLAALSCLYVGAQSMANLPMGQLRAAARSLLAGKLEVPPPAPSGWRSRALRVCQTCLGPVVP